MRRISIAISIVALAAALAPVVSQAACPGAVPGAACAALPPGTADLLPAQGCRGPLPPNVCAFLPVSPPAMGGSNQNVLLVNNTVTPADTIIYTGSQINFQNLDLENHSVTDAGCWDGAAKTGTCKFDTEIRVGRYGPNAIPFVVDGQHFKVGDTYDFVCKYHDTMKGSFTVTAY